MDARHGDAAQEARALVGDSGTAALATLSEDGGPWASLVLYAALEDGAPVLCLSALAEHGRNARRDPRASLVIAEGRAALGRDDAGGLDAAGGRGEPAGGRDQAGGHGDRAGRDPLDRGRVTLAGRLEEPAGDEAQAARAAYAAAADYGAFGDFTYYVLRVERVRWVGGYGRMATVDPAAYHAVRARGT